MKSVKISGSFRYTELTLNNTMMKQIFIVIIICYLLACENKKQNTNQEINKGIGEIQIKKQTYQKEEFVYSIKNIKDKYKNIKIVLEKDSLKILDLEFQTMICSSEIIKRKKHIKDYWGIGNSKEIKKELWNGLGFQLTDSIEVIENVKSELSREGCQFPFYEMFISNNFLFFYDENYYCFVSKEVEESLHVAKLSPYQKKIDINTIVYKKMPATTIKGLSDFACGEEQIRYVDLEKIDNLSLFLVPLDCGDFPYRFYLISSINSSVVSSLYVEGECSEPGKDDILEETSFIIDEKSTIIVKTTNKEFEQGKNEEKKYQILEDGRIIELRSQNNFIYLR